jgi:hypothetical protein
MPGAVLRVGGSTAAIRRRLGVTRMKPHRIYIRGEPVVSGSKILARHSYFFGDGVACSGQ